MRSHLFIKIDLFDKKILLLTQRWRHSLLNNFFLILTYTGTGKVWFTFAILINLLHNQNVHIFKEQSGLIKALFAPLLAWILGLILKKIVSRERPSSAINGFVELIKSPSCNSFPSGHTAASISFFVALIYIGHPLALLIGLWAMLISFSRLYLGVHYFSDICGGIILGIFSALVVVPPI